MSKNSSKKDVTFYCFTPLVSLATFIIEIALALYVILKFKPSTFNIISVITFICLGTFQLSEYMICTTPFEDLWIKIGYIAITILPALGVHAATEITRKNNLFVASGYVFAGLLILGIIFIPGINLQTSCQPRYVEIFVSNWYNFLHTGYYAIYVLLSIYILWSSLFKHVGDSKEEKWLIFAYATFLIPSQGLYLIRMITNSAIPSVMCGFAVIAAIILTFIVIPRQSRLVSKKKKKK